MRPLLVRPLLGTGAVTVSHSLPLPVASGVDRKREELAVPFERGWALSCLVLFLSGYAPAYTSLFALHCIIFQTCGLSLKFTSCLDTHLQSLGLHQDGNKLLPWHFAGSRTIWIPTSRQCVCVCATELSEPLSCSKFACMK